MVNLLTHNKLLKVRFLLRLKKNINFLLVYSLLYYLNSHKSRNYFKRHRFHIITKNDSLPFFTSLVIGSVFLTFVNYLHYNVDSFFLN